MARTLTAFKITRREDSSLSDMWATGIADGGCRSVLGLPLSHFPAEMPQALAAAFWSLTISHRFFFFFFKVKHRPLCFMSCQLSGLLPSPLTTNQLQQMERRYICSRWGWPWGSAFAPQWVLPAGEAQWMVVLLLPSLGGLWSPHPQPLTYLWSCIPLPNQIMSSLPPNLGQNFTVYKVLL